MQQGRPETDGAPAAGGRALVLWGRAQSPAVQSGGTGTQPQRHPRLPPSVPAGCYLAGVQKICGCTGLRQSSWGRSQRCGTVLKHLSATAQETARVTLVRTRGEGIPSRTDTQRPARGLFLSDIGFCK
ncbi:hypothetical protein NDU88_003608 [Pleurodeles waltl]|uniref:Uncharacterized protein n=1 Tax=Pleurodeles waltl TaxID=8319 RepID=A0AAV7RER4_PLEWA|nr:hypothetical protein NDU88_003608 [Pleurodeles waltl]